MIHNFLKIYVVGVNLSECKCSQFALFCGNSLHTKVLTQTKAKPIKIENKNYHKTTRSKTSS